MLVGVDLDGTEVLAVAVEGDEVVPVGGGLVLDGALRHGPSGLTGEIGHTIVREGGPSRSSTST